MVIIEHWPPWDTLPSTNPNPFAPTDTFYLTNTLDSKEEIKERHIKEVKKGVLVKFEDNSWMFLATDDECYQKLKKEIDSQ